MPEDKLTLLQRIPDWKQLFHLVGKRGIAGNIPFILYCAMLGIVYIMFNHFAENTIRDINRTARELRELRWKYIDEKTQIMFLTKESQLEKSAVLLGLNKTKIPPQKIPVHLPRPNEDQ